LRSIELAPINPDRTISTLVVQPRESLAVKRRCRTL
jgi:hypothetical protein